MEYKDKIETTLSVLVLIELFIALISVVLMIWIPFVIGLKMFITDLVFFGFTLFIYYFSIYKPQMEEEEKAKKEARLSRLRNNNYSDIPKKSDFAKKIESKLKEEATIKLKNYNND